MNTNPSPLKRFLERVCADEFFVGYALAVYQTTHQINAAKLAEWLKCDQKEMERLALCRRPSDEASDFGREAELIASFCRCDPDRLVQLLRAVAALDSLVERKTSSEGLLMAARDRSKSQNKRPGSAQKKPPNAGDDE